MNTSHSASALLFVHTRPEMSVLTLPAYHNGMASVVLHLQKLKVLKFWPSNVTALSIRKFHANVLFLKLGRSAKFMSSAIVLLLNLGTRPIYHLQQPCFSSFAAFQSNLLDGGAGPQRVITLQGQARPGFVRMTLQADSRQNLEACKSF